MKTLILRLFKIVRPFLKYLVIVQILNLVTLSAKSVLPFMMKQLSDSLQQGDTSVLTWVPLVAFAVVASLALVTAVRTFITSRIGMMLDYDLQTQLYTKYMEMGISDHFKFPVGEKMSRISFDTQYLIQGAMILASQLVFFPITILVYLVIMFSLDWKMSVFSLLVVPPVILMNVVIGKKLKATSRDLQNQNGSLSKHLVDSLSGIVVVKAFRRENRENQIFGRIQDDLLSLRSRDAKWQSFVGPGTKIINAFFFCLIGWVAFYRITVDGGLELPTFIAFSSVLFLFQNTLSQMGSVIEKCNRASSSLDRVEEVLNMKTLARDSGMRNIPEFTKGIDVRNLEFAYEDKPILNGLNFSIPKGALVVFSGLSGAGKTTMTRLLVGLLSPQKGGVYLDGVDFREIHDDAFRRLFSFVPQTTTLFNTTIRENISYGQPSSSEEDLLNASKMACAHDFIQGLPKGYDTEVGDMGEHLSAGQRQRITIARSLLQHSDILVFDECFSNIDYVTERRIYENLRSYRGQKTIILVTHRLSSVTDADHIYHFENGHVTEEGTHQELMKAYDGYHHLFRMQEHLQSLSPEEGGSHEA